MKNKHKRYLADRAGVVGVVGFGKTGRALLDFLLEQKECEHIYLFNDTPLAAPEEVAARLDYESRGATFIIGESEFPRLADAELIILSPGVDGRKERYDPLREKGIAIISEIEFAFSFIEAPVIAVTGTNGKSTTVSLIHHFLSKNGFTSFLTGNIGTPLISEVKNIPDNAVVVVEVSSFQLEEIADFKPHIAAILNVTPDHLDRYKNLEDYYAAKLNIGKNQGTIDYLILNDGDPYLKEKENREGASAFPGTARKVWFSRLQRDLSSGAWLEGSNIHLKVNNIDEVISLRENPLRGVHNLENLLAAAAVARLMGVTAAGIEKAVKDFKGLPHRMEFAGKIGDVEFINDSKATNVDAALKSIAGIDAPMVLILGGKDKGGDFTMLRQSIKEKVDHVLLVGAAAHTIHRQLAGLDNGQRFIFVADFAAAVAEAYRLLAKKGGVALLAPGCASFDMFKNFEHRGDVFKEEVRKLKGSIHG
ncbi:MAG: UDP-N-acetylmuramoyl-L-alanine--D-glutamate ligase [Candidatus Aminicenantes bacterium]|nr:UDP-N-acetylmuramoyl-L-alanine--D-glutamate ligase [Candidatus Aminicenantes bacterium]